MLVEQVLFLRGEDRGNTRKKVKRVDLSTKVIAKMKTKAHVRQLGGRVR